MVSSDGSSDHHPLIRAFVTNSVDQSPFWEADSLLASLEIPCKYYGTKRIISVSKKPPPLVLVMSHMNPNHIHPSCLFKIHLGIALPSTNTSFNTLLPSHLPPYRQLYDSISNTLPVCLWEIQTYCTITWKVKHSTLSQVTNLRSQFLWGTSKTVGHAWPCYCPSNRRK